MATKTLLFSQRTHRLCADFIWTQIQQRLFSLLLQDCDKMELGCQTEKNESLVRSRTRRSRGFRIFASQSLQGRIYEKVQVAELSACVRL